MRVVVEALHVAHRGVDALGDRRRFRLAVLRRGIVPRMEQRDQQAREIGIARQRLLDIVLAEGEAGLAQEFRDGAQDRHVAPGKARGQHQPVEPVRSPPCPGSPRGTHLPTAAGWRRDRPGPSSARSIVKSRTVASWVQPVAGLQRYREGVLGDHLQAEILEDRQRQRERQGRRPAHRASAAIRYARRCCGDRHAPAGAGPCRGPRVRRSRSGRGRAPPRSARRSRDSRARNAPGAPASAACPRSRRARSPWPGRSRRPRCGWRRGSALRDAAR